MKKNLSKLQEIYKRRMELPTEEAKYRSSKKYISTLKNIKERDSDFKYVVSGNLKDLAQEFKNKREEKKA
jgi:hypothetical protein